ncbi:hypothetical protein SPRG_08070 [Saprolegnia parasitica CBS 223.65]|uniref:Apple domain-containing protein n=1 Tax=Saprolegnia parasitica (strain CBS 223.65) TaxID=695850 RepID=A0A067CC90_SAPPC|nr:hypothetical protein SPRG_08070 [Saprolegnia parasitica CBS 223.65]KDO26780.1 hypothetical protein SPRG_08070 [Saprolegnia parasitica CBS 223.65]|eukprot:XP_012202429.1 hypothetical protein SPRG_08070 [Saprolegnia parasitica CBS 223.65]
MSTRPTPRTAAGTLTVTKQPKNPKSKYIVIEGATHCEDTYLANGDGPMKDAIKVIGDAVAEFLADAAKTPAPTPAPTTKPVSSVTKHVYFVESDVEFLGYDIRTTARSSSNSCNDDCDNTPGCKLWVWTKHNGGICWLKNRQGQRKTSPGSKAGMFIDPLEQDKEDDSRMVFPE